MSNRDRTVYHEGSDFQFEHPEIALGAPSSYSLVNDPKHLAFVLSRYKFCAKMLQGKKKIMEVGSGDGIGLPLVAPVARQLYCVDWDKRHIDSVERRLKKYFKNIVLLHHDMNKSAPKIKVDAAYLIDVIEHVDPKKEKKFMNNIINCLKKDGVLILGTPNLEASKFASPCSEVQHINLKSMKTLRQLLEMYFKNVFMFGMNDEVLHTGYGPMCHFIWGMGVGLKK
ncbi:class I SAM-dependent methyltransferase [Candidatus Margulisiibacteriota bacterium]